MQGNVKKQTKFYLLVFFTLLMYKVVTETTEYHSCDPT